MRVFAALIVVISATLILSRAVGAGAADRPPGVSAADWAPITDSLGIVLTPSLKGPFIGTPAATPQDLLVPGTDEGYLMVKRYGGWQRLILVKGPTPTR
jgi:hypothetical protein